MRWLTGGGGGGEVVRWCWYIFPPDLTRPVTTVSEPSAPPEILEAQPSEIEEVFVKISPLISPVSSPPEEKQKVRQSWQSKSCEILLAGHCHCQQVQESDLRPEILFKIKELRVT